MRATTYLAAVTICAAAVIGCDTKEEPKTPVSPPPQPSMTEQTKSMTDAAGSTASDAAAKANEMAGTASDKAGAMATDAKNAAADASASMTDQVKTLIDQGMTYVKENKLNDADAVMAKLDGMKDQIPESLKGSYEQLKKAVDAAKAKGMIPGMGGK
jgi:ElaB/YqjD/DUF883 family membrane-anchored ribosome-binding protein